MQIARWVVHDPGEPMRLEEFDESPGADEVVIEVAGCGVCHTDLGFYYDGVPTRHPFPLALGHEISGRVVGAGAGAQDWLDADVIVPAVIPCGVCDACQAGHGAVCPHQIFPGNDVHGGFATHVIVPSGGLCRVPALDDPEVNPAGLELRALAVIADAVSTPYQAVKRSGLGPGDLAVFVGAGGVGGFGIQIARAFDAHVVAIDPSQERLDLVAEFGASLCLRPDELDHRELKGKVREFAKQHQVPGWRQKIFECSGTPAGQSTAFGLLGKAGYLSVVGFTPEQTTVRLSNLMAFDATAQGNWGCLPELYPEAVALVLSGKVGLGPFIEYRQLSEINEIFDGIHHRRISKRVILTPEA